MTLIRGSYSGNLRCELSHPSNTTIKTDAPKDNHGEGMFFSPTDLLAASLGSCILTIIGIRARDKGIEIGNPEFTIQKTMSSNPRKVGKVGVHIKFSVELSKEDKEYLEHEGRNCPVALSLSSSLIQEIIFEYA